MQMMLSSTHIPCVNIHSSLSSNSYVNKQVAVGLWSRGLTFKRSDILVRISNDSIHSRKNPDLYSVLQESPESGTTGTYNSYKLDTGENDTNSVSYVLDLESSAVKGSSVPSKPEVLAPVGGWPQLHAAIENGADAVYFGLSDFNARARAANFPPDELPSLVAYCHERGVHAYVALNVLVFDEELQVVEERVKSMAAAGVDAVIVQDLGVVELMRRVAPNLPIHGSTQMSITSHHGADFAHGLGVERVVVGRELSVKEIAKVSESSRAEVEAFVHGALCVSYSGQCFSSEAWGGRSANRGQCAQACRMAYGLVVDGALKDLGDMQYLLSPQDLMAVDLVPQLIEAGVSCFKIEGRLKGPEYVALTTRVYRQAVDAAWAERELANTAQARTALPIQEAGSAHRQTLVTEDVRRQLAQVFSRGQDAEHQGLTPGFLAGPRHQQLVRGRAPRHRGVYLGSVVEPPPGERGIWVQLAAPLRKGDGVVFDVGNPEEEEDGGIIHDMRGLRGAQLGEDLSRADSGTSSSGPVQLIFMDKQGSAPRSVLPGARVWRTKDPALEAALRDTYESLSHAARRKVDVDVTVAGELGTPLTLSLRDDAGHVASASSAIPLASAAKRAMACDDVVNAVGQLGDNALRCRNLDTHALRLDQGLFLPASELKSVRRAAAQDLLSQRVSHERAADMMPLPLLPHLLREIAAKESTETAPVASTSGRQHAPLRSTDPVTLRVLCRSRAQVDAALQVPWLQEVVLDFLEVQGLREAVAAVSAAGRRAVVATPRIMKPDEERLVAFYLRLGAHTLLLRSAGLLQNLMAMGGPGAVVERWGVTVPRLEGDFSLNAANVLSADLLLSSGLSRLAPTHDLNAHQLAGLARRLGPRAATTLEVIVHHHLPIFHTEHCVFCRFLSDGNSFLDCGHPCENHHVHLRDGSGADHLVLADMGCRNTVFNAAAQSAAFYMSDLVKAGYRTMRVELVDEAPEYVPQILEGYREVLLGLRGPGALWHWLNSLPDANGRPHGVSTGSLAPHKERTVAKMKPTAASIKS